MLEVAKMSTMYVYLMNGQTFETFMEEQEIDAEDKEQAQRVWDGIEKERASLQPGQSLSVPTEWS